MSQKPRGVQFESENCPDFKVLQIDGVVGNINQSGGHMTFFIDMPEFETNFVEGQGAICSVNTVKRVFLVDIRMSTENFKLISEWMKNNVDSYEKMVQSGSPPKLGDTSQLLYQ